MFAPVGTPQPVVDKLTGETEKIMKTDAFRKKAAELGAEARYMGPKELAAHTRSEFDRWAAVVKAANIQE